LVYGEQKLLKQEPHILMAENVINGQTTANAYVKNVPGNGEYNVTPLLTVGDEVPLLEGEFEEFTPSKDKTFAFPGIPDGLGVFETQDSYYVFSNHEYASTEEVEAPATGGSTPQNSGEIPESDVIEQPVVSDISSTIDGQIQGARVSVFQFDKDWNVIGGKNLIEKMVDSTGTYELDTKSGAYVNSETKETFSFNRFCSGYLAESGFEDGPIWFAPEETGPDGRGFAVTPDGTALALDGLGRYSKEQVLPAEEYRADNSNKTVLLSPEDFADGELYMFVGEQTADDPNGFENGDLYVLKVEGADDETIPEGERQTATWTKVPGDIALNPDGTVLSTWVNANDRSTNLQRPEDIAEDPNNPGTFYFATTGTREKPGGDVENDEDNAATPEEAANPYGRLYRFSLNPDDPTGEIKNFEMVQEGGPGNGVSYDNLDVDSNGKVVIQEDETAFGGDVMTAESRDARVWSYDIASDKITPILELDENAAGTEFNDPTEPGEWESSGIIEVAPSDFTPESRPGRSDYLLDVQAHTIKNSEENPDVLNGNYVQGGQLLLAEAAGELKFGTPEADDLTAYQEDTVFAGAGNDILDASTGRGDNRLYGQSDNDTLFAGANDTLVGSDNDDILFAGMGGSKLTGGEGQDQFWIVAAETPSSANTITDFQLGNDVIGVGGLPGVTSVDKLDFTQQGGDTLITAQGKELALLSATQASTLGANSFVFG